MHECPALLRLLDEVAEHLLGHFEVGNHAIFQRSYNSDMGGRAAQHLLRFLAERLHFAGTVIESNSRGLVDHDAPGPGIDPRVSRTQVNRQVGRKQAQQWAQIVNGDSGYPVEAHNTSWLDRAGRQSAGWITGSFFCPTRQGDWLAAHHGPPLRRSWAAIDQAAKKGCRARFNH